VRAHLRERERVCRGDVQYDSAVWELIMQYDAVADELKTVRLRWPPREG
jgi:hypothetical protein